MRRTKIVCTLGPASEREDTIDRLVAAGMNVARLNMSHGTRDWHARTIARVRRVAAARDVAVAVMQDLQGPKIRIGALAGGGPVELPTGGTVEITTEPVEGTAARLSTPYAPLPAEVRPGDRVMLADGLIELRVESTDADTIRCAVVHGGSLFPRQGINLPGTTISAPSLTDKDLADLAWGVAQGVDYIAVSFVRRPEDIAAARAAVRRAGAAIPLIAKLEKPQALHRLDDILDVTEGVMVARGDMGVELPPEEVPGWQKRIIEAANARRVTVITATQMLESMVHSPRPTRAEATDVANAIWDGTDAVMLSAETAAGAYPVEAAAMMDRIARAAERDRRFMHVGAAASRDVSAAPELGPRPGEAVPSPPDPTAPAPPGSPTRGGAPAPPATPVPRRAPATPSPHALDVPRAVGLAARRIEDALPDVTAIVAFTREGDTARLIANQRPRTPVLALTDDAEVYRRLALCWGVLPVMSAPAGDLPSMLFEAERAAREAGVARPDDTLLVVGHLPPAAPGSTNFLMLHRVGA